ncbi:MAG TPA: hypothetical protein DDZ91_07290, partial [Firmicutes bacterium]|nr:hypothetical protein [Bacillota bacterium]
EQLACRFTWLCFRSLRDGESSQRERLYRKHFEACSINVNFHLVFYLGQVVVNVDDLVGAKGEIYY